MPGFSINTGSGETNTVRTVRSHRWRIERLGPLGSDPLGFGPGTWYAKSFGFPDISSEKIKTEGAVIDYWHAGRIQYTEAILTFYDAISPGGSQPARDGSRQTLSSPSLQVLDENSGVTSYSKLLSEWASIVHGDALSGETSFTTVGLSDNYKDTSIFQLEAAGGVPTFEIKLVNSWPSKISHSELDYSDSSISEFAVQLTFDWYVSKNL